MGAQIGCRANRRSAICQVRFKLAINTDSRDKGAERQLPLLGASWKAR